jgi:urease accessory protein
LTPPSAPSAAPSSTRGLTLLLLLADGRLPAGGHAHSGGIEAAVAAGLVRGVADLESYLEGRLATTGRVDAAVAVASWRSSASHSRPRDVAVASWPSSASLARLQEIDAEASARMASPAQRAASRAQGRGLRRIARRCWPAAALDGLDSVHPDGPLVAMVLGVAGATGGLDALEVATAALWSVQSGPAWAAVRLLGLDPLEVTATLARRASDVDELARATAGDWGSGDRSLEDLPAAGAPLAEIGAEAHAAWEVRLFAS